MFFFCFKPNQLSLNLLAMNLVATRMLSDIPWFAAAAAFDTLMISECLNFFLQDALLSAMRNPASISASLALNTRNCVAVIC